MTNFKIYISQVKSLMKHLIVSIYFTYFHSVGFGGSVVSSYFVKCRLCVCVYGIYIYADCFHEFVHLIVSIKLLCNMLL